MFNLFEFALIATRYQLNFFSGKDLLIGQLIEHHLKLVLPVIVIALILESVVRDFEFDSIGIDVADIS